MQSNFFEKKKRKRNFNISIISRRRCGRILLFGQSNGAKSKKSKGTKSDIYNRIFKSYVLATLLYGSEAWRYTTSTLVPPQVFFNKCLRRLLWIYGPATISNEQLHIRTQCDEQNRKIMERKWRWIGHTLRNNIDKSSSEIRRAEGEEEDGRRHRGGKITMNSPLQKFRGTKQKQKLKSEFDGKVCLRHNPP